MDLVKMVPYEVEIRSVAEISVLYHEYRNRHPLSPEREIGSEYDISW